MIEALLYEKLDRGRVRCQVCQWRCVIASGKRGACATRENRDGTLYTLIYDQVSSANLDPIEKKPLFHFHPGTPVFSLGTLGCSFSCPGCQNWQISQREPREFDPMLARMTPAAAVEMAKRAGAKGICWTYNEPAIWLEHTLEGARLAKEAGLFTAYVTNGTATREQLDLIGPYLDAYRVDIKAFSREGYKAIAGFANYEGILENTQYAKERWGMHVECVTNVTPTVNDSDEMLRGIAEWIAAALGIDTPLARDAFLPVPGIRPFARYAAGAAGPRGRDRSRSRLALYLCWQCARRPAPGHPLPRLRPHGHPPVRLLRCPPGSAPRRLFQLRDGDCRAVGRVKGRVEGWMIG